MTHDARLPSIRPALLLFWTPRWHDWGEAPDGGSLITDTPLDVVIAAVVEVVFDKIVWPLGAAVVWALEWCLAVLLSPLALFASLLGIPRHRLVAVSRHDGELYEFARGSWYTVRRARAEMRWEAAPEARTPPAQ